jgi:predicted DNA binding CopG/RHH family protein
VLCAGLTDAGRALQFRLHDAQRWNSRRHRACGEKESQGEAMKSKQAKAKPIVVDAPEFRSEAEEARWWDRHQDLTADLLLKHGRRGAVPTKNVSVRLPVTDIERARKLAEKRGVGYQTLIKTLLHEALKRESKIEARTESKIA